MKNQIHTENYSLYNGDCMELLPTLPENSVDFSVYSPPFAGLYIYSSDKRDMSNNESHEDFLKHYEFLIAEMARVTKPGRINAVHCQDIITNTTKHNLWDFPHEIIRLYQKYGFTLNNRITIWKEPLEVRMRTMVQSLTHKNIVEDATRCFPALPDYILLFRKGGENKVPVRHENGLTEYPYFGEYPFLPMHEKQYGKWKHFYEKWKNFKGDPKENKLAHIIWQRYASSVWDDIRGNNVLDFKDSKEDDDEKHVHPLQLDIIDRLVYLYTNKGEVVLTPFMGVGSEVYSPVSMERKAIGIELKDSYFKQAELNMQGVENRFNVTKQLSLFNK
ncbi:MAG: site-specific DNA-methyltransferase [Porphyromonadaceae bacterium]|nr:site-specific DNA-methyltransferase [Porphyromonadaceae bacterium]